MNEETVIVLQRAKIASENILAIMVGRCGWEGEDKWHQDKGYMISTENLRAVVDESRKITDGIEALLTIDAIVKEVHI
jgi:hypothetical protein